MYRLPIALLSLAAAVLLVVSASAIPGDTKGQIVSVNAEKLEFEMKVDGKEKRTYKLDEDATTFINDRKAAFKELKADDQVSVKDRKGGDAWYATVIRAERQEKKQEKKKDVGVVQDTKGELVSIDMPKLKFEMKVNGAEKRNYMLGEDATTYINGKVAAFQDLRIGDQLSVTDRKDEDRWLAIIINCERK